MGACPGQRLRSDFKGGVASDQADLNRRVQVPDAYRPTVSLLQASAPLRSARTGAIARVGPTSALGDEADLGGYPVAPRGGCAARCLVVRPVRHVANRQADRLRECEPSGDTVSKGPESEQRRGS